MIKLKLKYTTLSEQFRNRGKIDITKTHDHSLPWLGTGNKKLWC